MLLLLPCFVLLCSASVRSSPCRILSSPPAPTLPLILCPKFHHGTISLTAPFGLACTARSTSQTTEEAAARAMRSFCKPNSLRMCGQGKGTVYRQQCVYQQQGHSRAGNVGMDEQTTRHTDEQRSCCICHLFLFFEFFLMSLSGKRYACALRAAATCCAPRRLLRRHLGAPLQTWRSAGASAGP